MTLNLASLNVRGLRDSSKCTRLLGELKNLGVDVAAVQETHFTCSADCRVLEGDFNVFSAYGSRTNAGVSLLVGGIFDADVDVVFADDGDRQMWYFGNCCGHGDEWMVMYCTVEWVGKCG